MLLLCAALPRCARCVRRSYETAWPWLVPRQRIADRTGRHFIFCLFAAFYGFVVVFVLSVLLPGDHTQQHSGGVSRVASLSCPIVPWSHYTNDMLQGVGFVATALEWFVISRSPA